MMVPVNSTGFGSWPSRLSVDSGWSVFHWKRLGRVPPMAAVMNACFGFMSFFGGLAVGVILLFTKPPAFELLSQESLPIIGLVTLIATTYLGVTQVISNLFPDKPPQGP